MIDHEDKIKDALEDIPGLKTLSGTWPNDKTQYPAIIIGLASDRTEDYRDDRTYITELVYYVRIFDTDKKRMRDILAQVDQRMEGIRYQRTHRSEQNDAQVKQWIMHYTTFTTED